MGASKRKRSFINDINKIAMKFTTEWSEISIYFLDVTVSIAKGIIETVSYVKPIDSHQYLL